VPVFFVMMKEQALKRGHLAHQEKEEDLIPLEEKRT